MSDAACIALAAAVVRHAVAEYMEPRTSPAALAKLREFFHTSLIVAIAGINSKELLRTLDRERLDRVTRTAE